MNPPNTAPFDSEASFRQAIDSVIAAATQEIRVFDQDLTRIALDTKDRAEAIERFLAEDRERRLRIVLHDPGHCERHSPRLMALIRRFGQAVEIRQSPDELRHLQECFLLADRIQAVIRFHRDHPRGKIILNAPEEIHPWWRRFEELWTLSAPCLSATRLGL
jgi:hypothetical protein